MRILFCSWFILCASAGSFCQQNIFFAPEKYHLQSYSTIEQSILPPAGFQRVKIARNTFASYLRQLPLLPDSFDVLDFRDRIWKKSGDSTVAGIVPVNISGKRLWQCMDILIAFHVQYKTVVNDPLIVYPLPDGTLLSWGEWQKGMRPLFSGSKFIKTENAKADSTWRNLNRYLNTIFEYTGTQSFWHYYPDIDPKDIRPGDFIVRQGKRGHAVLIADIAENAHGEKVALIGQGDTPACQFYLLRNSAGSPWFKVDLQSSQPDLPVKKQMLWSGLRRFPE